MKIVEVRAVEIDLYPSPTTEPRPVQPRYSGMNQPLDRYDPERRLKQPPWHRAACLVTAADGITSLTVATAVLSGGRSRQTVKI